MSHIAPLETSCNAVPVLNGLVAPLVLPTLQQGKPPSARRGHACTVLGEHRLMVHGGFDGTSHLGDTYVLDVPTLLWTRVAVGGELMRVAPCTPVPPVSTAACLHLRAGLLVVSDTAPLFQCRCPQ